MAKTVLTGICVFLHTTQNGRDVGTGTPKPVWGNILVFDQTNTFEPQIVAKPVDLAVKKKAGPHWFFLACKRPFDILFCIVLFPIFLVVALALLVANPFFNQGPLFYFQPRMGKNCRAFRLVKFRSMRCTDKLSRSSNDPLETDRITPLGRFMRKSRIDELPQILNVLAGDMSLIGPRPDYFHHARRFVQSVPGYRERHTVRPGISGLAQIELGYIEGHDATARKVKSDLHYIKNAGFRLEMWIFWQTVLTVLSRRGS
ncbi:MAG: sugar transferase [Pseudomonadota bacterium]|nr:sugar transferase [Pseudomonadota bacterium]